MHDSGVSPEAAPAGGCILVAENDPLTAGLLRHRLARDGWPVTVVSDGTAAQQVLNGGDVALAVLSTRLPGTSGFELVRLIRQQAGRQPAVILLSHSTHEQDLVQAFALGADDYLLKPFSPVEFLARARRLLRASAPAAP
jgi:DNA-binding response OmpR family regulator